MTQEIIIPTCTWVVIYMDLFVRVSRTRKQHNSIWVIVDRMIRTSRFLIIRTTDSVELYSKLYIDEIIRFHGVYLSITADRVPHFIFHFCNSFQKGLGTHVLGFFGMLTFLLLSLATTKTTIPAFKWPLMKPYMGVDVDLSLVRLKQVKQFLQD